MTARRNTETTEVTEGETLTAKELATEFASDPKTIRKFLRSLSTERPGKGGRWAINRSDLPAVKARFDAFNSRKAVTLTLSDED